MVDAADFADVIDVIGDVGDRGVMRLWMRFAPFIHGGVELGYVFDGFLQTFLFLMLVVIPLLVRVNEIFGIEIDHDDAVVFGEHLQDFVGGVARMIAEGSGVRMGEHDGSFGNFERGDHRVF